MGGDVGSRSYRGGDPISECQSGAIMASLHFHYSLIRGGLKTAPQLLRPSGRFYILGISFRGPRDILGYPYCSILAGERAVSGSPFPGTRAVRLGAPVAASRTRMRARASSRVPFHELSLTVNDATYLPAATEYLNERAPKAFHARCMGPLPLYLLTPLIKGASDSVRL
ncbi:hypothetical protein VNO77_02484 [Canavalia gladiata]|uniref:Uncharacterized protein n=1 Tax=Canavalia gladiata TaxID=3824 RepID=A0AAN9MZK8_CANGL